MERKKIKKSFFSSSCVCITGASSGIGKEIARILIRDYNVTVIAVARNIDKLNETRKEFARDFADNYNKYLPLALDVTHEGSAEKIKEFMISNNLKIKLLISNAGQMQKFETFMKSGQELGASTLKQLFHVNFTSNLNLAKEFLEEFKQREEEMNGIVFIGSSASVVPIPGAGIYSASKSALKSFVEVIQAENTNKNTYIGLMMPGMTNTGLFASTGKDLPSWVKKLMTPAPKMAKKIVKHIVKRRKAKLIGGDAHLMNFCYKIAPRTFLKTFRKLLVAFKIVG